MILLKLNNSAHWTTGSFF